MYEITQSLGWAIVFMAVGGIGGIALVVAVSALLPKLLNRITPHIDEEKEIVRGNVAVAQYFGRASSAPASSLPPLCWAEFWRPVFNHSSRGFRYEDMAGGCVVSLRIRLLDGA